MSLAEKILNGISAGIVSLPIFVGEPSYGHDKSTNYRPLPAGLEEYSAKNNIPLDHTEKLSINVKNKDIKVAFLPFMEGIKQAGKLAEKKFTEEAWVFVPYEDGKNGYFVEVGVSESLKGIVPRRDLTRVLTSKNEKSTLIHIHPLRRNLYENILPSEGDISEVFRTANHGRFPKDKIFNDSNSIVINPLGYSEWTYTKKGKHLFEKRKNFPGFNIADNYSLCSNGKDMKKIDRRMVNKIVNCVNKNGEIKIKVNFFSDRN